MSHLRRDEHDSLGPVDLTRERQKASKVHRAVESSMTPSQFTGSHAARIAQATEYAKQQRLAREQSRHVPQKEQAGAHPRARRAQALRHHNQAPLQAQEPDALTVMLATRQKEKTHAQLEIDRAMEELHASEEATLVRRVQIREPVQDPKPIQQSTPGLAKLEAHVMRQDPGRMRRRQQAELEQRAADARRQAQKVADQRKPNWWPRTLMVEPPARPPPSPRTVTAATARLSDIQSRFAAGKQLSEVDTSDAAAIFELHEIWRTNEMRASRHAHVQARPMLQAEPPSRKFRANGDEIAALIVGQA